MSGAGQTTITVGLPLPLDVASALTKLIGSAYPSSTLDASLGHRGLVFKIDPSDRVDVADDEARRIVLESQPDLVRWDRDGMSTSTPGEQMLVLGDMAHAIFTSTEGAVNYVEWQVHTDAGDEYVLTIAKRGGTTPATALDKVRALHFAEDGIHGHKVCAHRYCVDGALDQHRWPCPTAEAIGAAA